MEAAQQGVRIARLEAAQVANDLDPVEAALAQAPLRRQPQVLHLLDGVAQHPAADGVYGDRILATDEYVPLYAEAGRVE